MLQAKFEESGGSGYGVKYIRVLQQEVEETGCFLLCLVRETESSAQGRRNDVIRSTQCVLHATIFSRAIIFSSAVDRPILTMHMHDMGTTRSHCRSAACISQGCATCASW